MQPLSSLLFGSMALQILALETQPVVIWKSFISNAVTPTPRGKEDSLTQNHQMTPRYHTTERPRTVQYYRQHGRWTIEHVDPYIFPSTDGDIALSTVLTLSMPQKYDHWVERVTFANSNKTLLAPDGEWKPSNVADFVAKTRDGACDHHSRHRVTINAHPQISDLWATQMTFQRMSYGYACGGNPPYPSKVRRCMAIYTSAWTAPFKVLQIKTRITTTLTKLPGGTVSTIRHTRTENSTSASFITISKPHWGIRFPEEIFSATGSKRRDRACHDEISCYYSCEREHNAMVRLAIILASILGALLLIIAPVLYFWNQPQHLRRLRERAREGRLQRGDPGSSRAEKGAVTAGDVVAQRETNDYVTMGTSEGRTTPRKMSTYYNDVKRQHGKRGILARFWLRLWGRSG